MRDLRHREPPAKEGNRHRTTVALVQKVISGVRLRPLRRIKPLQGRPQHRGSFLHAGAARLLPGLGGGPGLRMQAKYRRCREACQDPCSRWHQGTDMMVSVGSSNPWKHAARRCWARNGGPLVVRRESGGGSDRSPIDDAFIAFIMVSGLGGHGRHAGFRRRLAPLDDPTAMAR